MVHILFDTSTVTYDNFLHPQNGGGIIGEIEGGNVGGMDEGNGNNPKLPTDFQYFFKGSPFQRGYGGRRRIYGRYWQRGAGISDILRSLWRILYPVLKKKPGRHWEGRVF